MSDIAQTVVALALLISCVIVASFCVLFPILDTIMGRLRTPKAFRAEMQLRRPFDSFISDMELGPTMADGGERTMKGQAEQTQNRS
jgi:hypothetical protein